jgi:hypothetical protein
LEDAGDYSTLCYESTSNTMQDYVNCSVITLDNQNFDISTLKVYPNPVKSVLQIDYSEKIDIIQVYDVVGKQCLFLQSNFSNNTLDFSNFESGTYFVKIILKNNSITFKVIKN